MVDETSRQFHLADRTEAQPLDGGFRQQALEQMVAFIHQHLG